MKKKKKIHRVVALVATLILTVSCIGVTSPYYASDSAPINVQVFLRACGLPELPNYNLDSRYFVFDSRFDDGSGLIQCFELKSGETNFFYYGDTFGRRNVREIKYVNHVLNYTDSTHDIEWTSREFTDSKTSRITSYSGNLDSAKLFYSDFDIYADSELSGVVHSSGTYQVYDVGFVDSVPIGGTYNPLLGYLQNISRKSTYIRGALYNYDEDSLTYHWYHDLITTSGVDLSSGDYVVRHYVSMATVTGYEKSDIVKMSDMSLMAEYDASKGYFSYLDKDYMDRLYAFGYEDLSFFDFVFRGYFTLEHNYFQIVNKSTNEFGGYLHLYPHDSDSDNFGVELEYEGLDEQLNVDGDAPDGNIKPSTGSGETIDEALENADEPKLDDLSGVTEFVNIVRAYSSEVENVASGFGAFFAEFPPWVTGVLGLSFAFLIIIVVIKCMR